MGLGALGFRVSGFRDKGLGFRGFRVEGFGVNPKPCYT